MAGPFYPDSNASPGDSLAQPGAVQPGDPGFSAGYQVGVSSLVRGSFITTTAVSTYAAKETITNATVAGLVKGIYTDSVPVSAVTKQVFTNTVSVSTAVGGLFFASTLVTTVVTAHRGPITATMTAAVFPAAPELYTGNVPTHSSVVLETLQLMPSLYNLDPEPVPVLTVGIATTTPPATATSAAMQHLAPTYAPVVTKLESVTANLTTGTYQIAYTYWSAQGETVLSPIATVALDVAKTQAIQVGALPLPNGATEIHYYLKTPSATVFQLVTSSTTGLATTISQAGETVSVRVDGTLLQVTATGGEVPVFSCDLRDFTLTTLAYQLQKSGFLASPTNGWGDIAATILLDNFYGPDPQVSLLGFTSVLWRIIRPIALCFDLWGDDLDLSVQQLDVRFASGRWLDWWGILYGVPRVNNETDNAYRKRITWEVMAPRCNNTALEIILKEALGYDATVSDSGGFAITWYSNRNAAGTPLRDPATGYPTGITVSDPQGAFVTGLSAWDATSTYNSSTFTWTVADVGPLLWGESKPSGTLIDPATAPVSWPGHPGQFHIAITQVVEDGQLGVNEITDLINRYKAAAFKFTLSVISHYTELFDAANVMSASVQENLEDSNATGAGTFLVTGTMGSLTMQWPFQPVYEAILFEEWSFDAGATWQPWGTDAVISSNPDPQGNLPLGLAATDQDQPAAPPGYILTG